MNPKIFAFSFILLALLLFGCTQQQQPQEQTQQPRQQAPQQLEPHVQACVDLCNAEKARGSDLSTGPCIGNPLQQYPGWVCDVAHSPRADADNLPENQCSAFREGIAGHFVEVDEGCEVINVN